MIRRIKYNLLENSIDYFNQSLHNVLEAQETNNQKYWKYALLNLILSIELLLKEKLRRKSEILIYDNIDKYKERNRKTVSFTTAIERLKYLLDDKFTKIDSGRLLQAINIRNSSIHYIFELKFPLAYDYYTNLFNFYCEFYKCYIKPHTREELYTKIYDEYRNEFQTSILNFREKRAKLFFNLL